MKDNHTRGRHGPHWRSETESYPCLLTDRCGVAFMTDRIRSRSWNFEYRNRIAVEQRPIL